MRVVIGLVALVLATMIVVGVTSSSRSEASRTPAPAVGNAYSTDTLARASAMTQQMSGNGPVTGYEYRAPHSNDEQLRLSESSPVFIRQIEGYQQQIDRMLARNQ